MNNKKKIKRVDVKSKLNQIKDEDDFDEVTMTKEEYQDLINVINEIPKLKKQVKVITKEKEDVEEKTRMQSSAGIDDTKLYSLEEIAEVLRMDKDYLKRLYEKKPIECVRVVFETSQTLANAHVEGLSKAQVGVNGESIWKSLRDMKEFLDRFDAPVIRNGIRAIDDVQEYVRTIIDLDKINLVGRDAMMLVFHKGRIEKWIKDPKDALKNEDLVERKEDDDWKVKFEKKEEEYAKLVQVKVDLENDKKKLKKDIEELEKEIKKLKESEDDDKNKFDPEAIEEQKNIDQSVGE